MHFEYVPPLIQLAPMEGVLDGLLREMLARVGGLDRLVTEFVRVTDRLLPAHVFYKYCPELQNDGQTANGVPVFVQLLGGQPGPMAENAGQVAALGAPGIDLNFGCPAKTVNRHDGGATLLKKPSRLFDVASAVRKAVPTGTAVTAKVRLGFDHKDFHREIAAALEEAGVQHIVVHARTKTEMYTPPAHWTFIRSMSEGRTVPFLANGEIWSTADYQKCRADSGVERVALGRGLVARPTLAREIRGETPASFHAVEFLNEFFKRSVEQRGPSFGLARFKQLLRYWSRNGGEHAEWFNEVKVYSRIDQIQEFFIRRHQEEKSCLKFSSTRLNIAPTASVPSNF